MIRTFAFWILVIAAAAQTTENAALEGLDPVLLTQGKEEPGKDSITVHHGLFLYRFASPQTRDRFLKDPARFAIQLDGACARMGAPVVGLPDSYYVYDGRIYIFGSADCYKAFTANPKQYLESEQPNVPWNPTSAERRQGRKLLEEALAAMGGGANWNKIRSYSETRQVTTGPNVVTERTTARLPGSFVRLTKNGKLQFGQLVSPSSALRFAGDQTFPEPQSFSKTLLADLKTSIVPLLLDRNASGFDCYYSGRQDGMDRLEINEDGIRRTLLINPDSHRIDGMLWRSRGPSGFNDFRSRYSDFRETGGLVLPFQVEIGVEDQPGRSRSFHVESYDWNPTDIDARLSASTRLP
ncbi:MAG TPA: hypothetical protein VKU19_23025 [Bryobacteraceae bacterium]|nr:hypothetical protein [Bryobacteraceae bacterium]